MAVNITDKFGKASSATKSAASTTVKTARESGQQTLACFDLSAFAQDTPVYFITYQRQTDPTTGAISTVNQVSYKGIVNIDNNTIIDIEPSAGFTDLGNSVGDYVECVPTSQWANDLVDGIKTTLKADGTLQDNVAAGNVNAGTTKILSQNVDFATPRWVTVKPAAIPNTGKYTYGTWLFNNFNHFRFSVEGDWPSRQWVSFVLFDAFSGGAWISMAGLNPSNDNSEETTNSGDTSVFRFTRAATSTAGSMHGYFHKANSFYGESVSRVSGSSTTVIGGFLAKNPAYSQWSAIGIGGTVNRMVLVLEVLIENADQMAIARQHLDQVVL